MSGRRKDIVWNRFTELKTDSGKLRAKCKKCKKEMVSLVARMRAHTRKCYSLDLEENKENKNSENSDIDIIEHEKNISSDDDNIDNSNFSEADTIKSTVTSNSSSIATTDTSKQSKHKHSFSKKSLMNYGEASTSKITFEEYEPPEPEPPKKKSKLDYFLTRTTESQKRKFHKQVAKFIFATNSSFRHVEHPEFIKLVNMLHPGYNPPNRRQISNELLNEVFEEENEKMKNNLRGKTICMSLDGWSNIHNESIICISAANVVDETVDLCDTIDTEDNSHSSEYLLKLAIKSIKKCQQYGCTVRSFVTDNASNMSKMRTDLAASEEFDMSADIITYGCSAHILNLFAHDIEIPGIKGHIKRIIKYFRNTHIPGSKYKQEGGKKLVLPQDVRWNTLADCLESYLKNWHILSKVCSENKLLIDKDILNLINDINLKNNAADYLEKLKIISVALDKMQADQCTIGEATQIWLNLEEELNKLSQFTEADKKHLKARFNMAKTPAHFLANLLDHRFVARKLKDEQLDQAMEYANIYYPDTLPQILAYRAKIFPYKEYLFSDSLKKTKPMVWWLSIKDLDTYMLNLVSQLHTAVASSAGIERLFSAFGLVHNKLRNRLGVEKAGKLVTILKSLNRTYTD